MSEYVKTDDVVRFSANFYHPASGYAVAADSTPMWYVYEDGTAGAILNGDMSARSDFVGSYHGNFTASAANGFDSNSFYDVQVSGAVDSINAMTSVKQFVVDDVFDANTVQVSGETVTLADLQGDGGGASAADVWTYAGRTLTNLGDAAVSGDVAAAVLKSTLSDYNSPGSVGHAIVVASGNLISGDWTVIGDLSNLDAAVSSRMPTTHIDATAGAVDTVTTNTDMRGTDNAALAATALTNATWTDARAAYLDTIPNLSAKTDVEAVSGVLVARTLVSADYFDADNDAVAQVTLVDTTTDITNIVNANMVQVSGSDDTLRNFGYTYDGTGYGDNFAPAQQQQLDENKLYLVAVSGDTVAILADTDDLQTNQGNWLTADVSNLDATVSSRMPTTHIDATAGTVDNVTLVDTTTTNTDMVDISTLATSVNLEAVSGVLVARTLISADYFDADNDTVARVTLVDTTTDVTNNIDILSASGAIIDSIGGLNNISTTQVNAEVDTALADYDVATRENVMSTSGSIIDTLGTMDADIYFANVKYVKDTTNTQDEFGVQWFKNDQPVSSGELTSPSISIYNTSTGAALLEHQLMTYASPNLGVVRHNLSAVMASGEPYLVETSGTIDASVHTWKTIVGIDSL